MAISDIPNAYGDLLGTAELNTCCGAPCSCPCTTSWPPASWPCGGLNQTYSITCTIQFWDNVPCSGPFVCEETLTTVVSPGGSSCSWQSSQQSTPVCDVLYIIFLNRTSSCGGLGSCCWRIIFDSGWKPGKPYGDDIEAYKLFGSNPKGTYYVKPSDIGRCVGSFNPGYTDAWGYKIVGDKFVVS